MRILGLDIGTHSLGTFVRDTELGSNLKDQTVYFSVDSFNSGIGNGKKAEYSYAAERSGFRRKRILNERRRYRKWATLKLLIKYKMCPLTTSELEQWTTYDKSRGLYRQYPINAKNFESWIRLDFDQDGKPDYTSPYQLRRDLMSRQFDFSQENERFKLGRAIYHIAQRRGFKSSKGETLKELEQSDTINDVLELLKKSESEKSSYLVEYMNSHNLRTVGCAFARLEDERIRIRGSKYQAVRSQYKDEIKEIFAFQTGLANEQELLNHLLSEKKGEGSIFYKCPLKSQKGLVGKCTLEPNKTRCPISHPKFEEFRAWSFINNIKYRAHAHEDWKELSICEKELIYSEIFTSKVRNDFPFSKIKEWIEKHHNLKLEHNEKNSTINYDDNCNVSGCPITARFIKLLGTDWESYKLQGSKKRWSHSKNKHTLHTTSYDAYDIWHACYSIEEESDICSFAKIRLGWNDTDIQQLLDIWSKMKDGYAMISLKAINNINYFLRQGYIYSDAVILAKLPDIIGSAKWLAQEKEYLDLIRKVYYEIKQTHTAEKTINNISNLLIANYKSLGFSTGIFAYKDYKYTLNNEDKQDILKAVKDHYGHLRWNNMCEEKRNNILRMVEEKYQSFFFDKKRAYISTPKISTLLTDALSDLLGKELDFGKLYHHSNISPYVNKQNGDKLGNPNMGAIKNPVALRTLQIIRKKINALIENNIIDPEDTIVVIETAREFNNANMRWALKKHQECKEEERKNIENLLKEFYPTRTISDTDINKARFYFEQQENYINKFATEQYEKDKDLAKKYQLWKEQACVCFYTGRIIKFTELFGETIQIEHTVPRSISYDDSMTNLTICDAHYNQAIKNNKIPSKLPNYEEDITIDGQTYKAILPQLKRWEKIVKRIKDNITTWEKRSRSAITKDRKDNCIRQIHLWKMELDYWHTKLEYFKQTEITHQFYNRQLVDTRLITAHSAIYLKSLFKKVEVQKGETTATFRKILGIQKNRDVLSHHAIDAMILTIIPTAAKRERMIKLFYQKEESYGQRKECYINDLKNEIKDCQIGNKIDNCISYINDHLLVNHISSDKTLVHAKKKIRKRGKIVLFKQSNGEAHFRVSTGNAIRASLHKESFYGAIKLPITNDNGAPIIENGQFIYSNEEPVIVKRISIREIKEGDAEKIIIDPRIRYSICKTIQKRKESGLSYKKAIEGDFYLLDKNDNEIKVDKKGRNLCPIRHVRCRVKAGAGYLTYKTALSIRKQINISQKSFVHLNNRNYKQKVYAQNDDNYLLLLYKEKTNGKSKSKVKIINYFDVAKQINIKSNKINNIKDLLNIYREIKEENTIYHLTAFIQKGTRLLKWDKSPKEIYTKNIEELSKCLYVTHAINDRIHYKHHLENGDTKAKSCSFGKMSFLIEGKDFEIDILGNIHLFQCHETNE